MVHPGVHYHFGFVCEYQVFLRFQILDEIFDEIVTCDKPVIVFISDIRDLFCFWCYFWSFGIKKRGTDWNTKQQTKKQTNNKADL